MVDDVFAVKATLELSGSNRDFEISSAHCVADRLFIGTSTGRVFSYNYDQKTSKFVAGLGADVTQDQTSEIIEIDSASALDRLLVHAAGHLFVLSLNCLETLGTARFKDVTCVALNGNPECQDGDDPFSVQVAVGVKSKKILLCRLDTETIHWQSTVSVDAPPLALSYNGSLLCFGTTSHYYVYECVSKQLTPLFPIDANDSKPLVQSVGQSEFLVCGMQGLGVFTDKSGISSRPPLLWAGDANVHSLATKWPYVLALGTRFLTVYDMNDQKIKQRLDAPLARENIGGKVDYCDGVICVTGATSVVLLTAVNWLQRMTALISDERISEALALADSHDIANERDPNAFQTYEELMCTAGFKLLEKCDFDTALGVFQNCGVDLREIISLFTGLLPSTSDFTRSKDIIHSLPNIEKVAKTPEQNANANMFLRNLLLHCREKNGRSWDGSFLMDIDTALVKLCQKIDGYLDECFKLEDPELSCNLADCIGWFKINGAYWSLTLILNHFGKFPDALDLCQQLCEGKFSDDNFPGIEKVFDILLGCKEPKIWSKHLQWIMTHVRKSCNQEIYQKKCEMIAKSIVGIMPSFSDAIEAVKGEPETFKCLLCILVLEMESQDPSQHNQLGQILAQSIIEKSQSKTGFNRFKPDHDDRKILRQLIATSECFDVGEMMINLEHPSLAAERAFLAGKNGDDQSALRALVFELGDVAAALDYCRMCPRVGGAYKVLVETVMNAYSETTISQEDALQVLSTAAIHVDFDWLVGLVPSSWPILSIFDSAKAALERSTHNRRMWQLADALSSRKLAHCQTDFVNAKKCHFRIDANTCVSALGDFFKVLQ